MPTVVAYVNNDGGSSVTSGTFNVAAGDLICLLAHSDEASDTNVTTWTISDNQTPDLTYTNIAERGGADAGAGAVLARYHIATDAITGYNVSVAVSGSVGSDSPAVKILLFASSEFDAADPIGNTPAEGNLTTDPQTTASITPETSGTGIAAWTDWNQTGVPTSSDLTATGFDTAGDISGGSGYKTLSAGVGATANMDSGATPAGNYLWFEIRAGSGAASSILRQMMNYHGG